MADPAAFLPQWTSPPGRTIAGALNARDLSRSHFAQLIDQTPDFVERLLEGREPITLGLARKLQDSVGGSVAFWMTRDRQYRDDVARLREAALPWLDELPLDDMFRLGWIEANVQTGFEVETLLRYFDVASVPDWRARYATVLEEAAYRTSPSFESKVGAVAAWLRQGERVADRVACAQWQPDALRATLIELRALSRVRDPQRFLPRLQLALAACGVAVAVIPATSGCRASGAVRWLSDEKALVILSARHLSDDHFWFTLFHECAHLLLHSDTRHFVDEDGGGETESATTFEVEANALAATLLMPAPHRDALARVQLNTRAVLRMAKEAGVAPGILVGQLQRMGRLPHNWLNRLKRRYRWDGDRLVSRESA